MAKKDNGIIWLISFFKSDNDRQNSIHWIIPDPWILSINSHINLLEFTLHGWNFKICHKNMLETRLDNCCYVYFEIILVYDWRLYRRMIFSWCQIRSSSGKSTPSGSSYLSSPVNECLLLKECLLTCHSSVVFYLFIYFSHTPIYGAGRGIDKDLPTVGFLNTSEAECTFPP